MSTVNGYRSGRLVVKNLIIVVNLSIPALVAKKQQYAGCRTGAWLKQTAGDVLAHPAEHPVNRSAENSVSSPQAVSALLKVRDLRTYLVTRHGAVRAVDGVSLTVGRA